MKVVITIEDVGGKINVKADFGEKGVNPESYIHYLALSAIEKISEIVGPADAED